MDFSNIKWIFFDIGNTLLDEDGVHLARMEEIAADTGKELPSPEVLIEEMIEAGTAGARSPFGVVAKKYGAKRNYPYSPALEIPFPETEETLKKLSKKYKLGIIANQRGGSAHRLQMHGLMKYIDFVYSSDEMGKAKPSPDLFLSALDAVGCRPEEACMVGDRIDNDIRTPKKLGMKAVRIRQGFFRNRPAESEFDIPDADIKSIGDLPGVFGM
ncbi:MAG: HAD family hydrolase [Eubacteriales bacterium]